MMLRREFQPSHLGVVLVACIWSLLSDDLSSVIFEQSTVHSIHYVSLEHWSKKIIHHFLDDDLVIYEKIRMEQDKEDKKKEEKNEKKEGERQKREERKAERAKRNGEKRE